MNRPALRVLLAAISVAIAAPTIADAAARRSIDDVFTQLDATQPRAERRAGRLAAADAPPPDAGDPAVLASFYQRRAEAAAALGRAQQRVDDLETALSFAERVNVPTWQSGERLSLLSQLASAWSTVHYRKSIAYAERVLAYPRVGTGYVIGENTRLANTHTSLGDFQAAGRYLARAEEALEKAKSGPDWERSGASWRTQVDFARGFRLRYQGKYAEAEAAFRSASARRSASQQAALRNLALAMQRQGRLDEAEVVARDCLRQALAQSGRDSLDVVNILRVLAIILGEQGRHAEAVALADRAVRIADEIGIARTAFASVWAWQVLGASQVDAGQYRDGADTFAALSREYARDPQVLGTVAQSGRAWGYALIRIGRAEEAARILRGAVDRSSRTLGASHIETAFDRGYLGMALVEMGQFDEALREMRASLDAIAGADGSQLDYVRRSARATARLGQIATAYIDLLARVRGSETERRSGIEAASESFRASDLLRGQVVQQALIAAAARVATDSPELAALVRQQQDLAQEEDALYALLLEQLSLPLEQQPVVEIERARVRVARIGEERTATNQRIEKSFPSYANFVNPRPPTVERAREALGDVEALVTFVTTPDKTFVWAVPKSGPVAFVEAPLGAREMANRVNRLRSALDPSMMRGTRLPDFDVVVAAALYDDLVKPVEGTVSKAKTLFVVTGGSLAQLPLSLLVDRIPDAASGNARYLDAGWLAHRYAVAQLPSVNALLTLRAGKPNSRARKAFTGFGDPQFTVPAALTAQGSEEGILAWQSYNRLAPLPDTRPEILAIARALGADVEQDVFLGAQATKAAVQAQGVGESRVIAFATHGLLPGDLPGLTQPALALSPAVSTLKGHEGPQSAMLTLEDVLRLKLNADWVVLSACNTAAGDGIGAEAVSGLGRAFFYAGSRALLVTHWPVETVSARLLVSALFDLYAADPAMTRVEALRLAMLRVMKDSPGGRAGGIASYAHPMFWAPYALIGDGGR